MPRIKTGEQKQDDQPETTEGQTVEAIEGEIVDEAIEEKELTPEAQEVEHLQEELTQAQEKAKEYLDGWQRSAAEFANYKRRIEREQVQNQQMATANAIKRFLEIFDDMERAIKNRPQAGEASGWAEGIELVYRKFLAYLESEGVKIIETEGQSFDPNLHEAISHEDHPKLESGQIIDVVQQGYRLGDRVLRPARVRVAR